MGIDEELRAAQQRRARDLAAQEQSERSRVTRQEAYHAEEAALIAELSEAGQRMTELLIAADRPGEVQVLARSRLRRDGGLVRGWRMSAPLWGPERVLLPSGDLVMQHPGSKDAKELGPMPLDTWIEHQVMRARFEFPRSEFAESGLNYYKLAFGGRSSPSEQYIKEMRHQLEAIRSRVLDIFGEVLTRAEITL